jgi:hypothetical protein
MFFNNSHIKYLFALSIGLLLGALSVTYAQSAIIKHQDEFVEAEVGETFETIVQFNTDGAPISVFDLHLKFDPEFIEVVSIENLQGDLFSFHQPPTFNNEEGRIDMAAFQIGKGLPEGDFDIVKITFLALNPVDLTEVIHPLNEFPKSMLAYAGENLLEDAGDLKIIILDSALGLDGSPGDSDFGLEIWPNPTSGIVTISFELKESDRVSLEIFNAQGKLVESVFEGTVYPGSDMRFEVDLERYASGTYSCRLQTKSASQTKNLMLTE